MSSDNIAVNLLREKEKEYEVALDEIRVAIDILMKSDIKRSVKLKSKNFEYIDTITVNKDSIMVGKSEMSDVIADAITHINRFATKYEIMEVMSTSKNIASALSTAKREKKRGITSYSHSGAQKHTVWGFTTWLDQYGNPKPEYAAKFSVSVNGAEFTIYETDPLLQPLSDLDDPEG